MAGARRRARLRLLPDAHARRAADDAGRPALRGRRRRRQGVPRGAARGRASRPGIAEERIAARPGHRLRQDARAQPRAAAAARRARRARAARSSSAPRASRSSARITGRDEPPTALPGTIATNVLALERGASVFRVHDVAPVARRARGGGCYGARPMSRRATTSPTTTTTSTTSRRGRRALRAVVTIEITGLSLYTHHGVSEAEREVGQRLVLDLRLEVGDVRRDGHRPRRGHGRLRRGLPDASRSSPSSARTRRSSGCARRSPTACSTTTRPSACGSGGEARAADPAAGRGGLGRGLARRG